ncbi:hypothetical protein PI125_g8861 [Phytophthora idaei]|nr:hypothetical protein PI125_g8861 [Phytophthora idaei]KAG3151449.1 hypothetical protein PI126_g10997 [Phytophthora idaei]
MGTAKPKSSKKDKKAQKKKKNTAVENAASSERAGEERVPVEKDNKRPRTRFRGAKCVPVARVHVVVLKDPKNYHVAMKDPRSEKWGQAIRDEFEALA